MESGSTFDIPAFLATLTQRPGVYKMLDAQGAVIYVGKAKNLKKRVSSYFSKSSATPKQIAMVARIHAIEVTVTRTEGEALLLENQFIKRYKPRYNICLRDDKSYPHIYVSIHQEFPQLTFHRGARKRPGKYFGPYPSAGAVRESLKLLQKAFRVRQCEDSYFSNRSRPCLQHQIDRCTAPCVNLITAEAYRRDVEHTLLLLEGEGGRVIEELGATMDAAAQQLDFEKAARYRDRIATLRGILQKQFVAGEKGDLDMIACASQGGVACVQVFFIRKGQQLGDRTFFPKMEEAYDPGNVLAAFIGQYYLDKPVPTEILASHEPTDCALLTEVLAQQAKHGVQITWRVRGERARWLQMAQSNAENALRSQLAARMNMAARYASLKEELALPAIPERLECFDISHTQGGQTVASCVVFDGSGPLKSAYRRFNIEGETAGDDYAALAQAVGRRFARMKKGEHPAPDVLFIDGGKGQVGAVTQALSEMGLGDVMIVGVAKGRERRPGMETLFVPPDCRPLKLPPGSAALLLIQQIRDEAHRFAITGHRQRRGKAAQRSRLDDIPGLGPKRRQQLLKQFGGLGEIAKAGVEDLAALEGISRQLAERIHDALHDRDG
ncbi:UvrABC system protein C [Methylogaea oryzae]|uniref:UvrABC system protein C n=2 Tax=Methylogaea oryzae TaxID=1295382 RepID=A0A8D4VMN1_9GAMM|nr:UvrABC system protein C [Methylogaea oryzae]